jgi:hypothetical protein
MRRTPSEALTQRPEDLNAPTVESAKNGGENPNEINGRIFGQNGPSVPLNLFGRGYRWPGANGRSLARISAAVDRRSPAGMIPPQNLQRCCSGIETGLSNTRYSTCLPSIGRNERGASWPGRPLATSSKFGLVLGFHRRALACRRWQRLALGVDELLTIGLDLAAEPTIRIRRGLDRSGDVASVYAAINRRRMKRAPGASEVGAHERKVVEVVVNDREHGECDSFSPLGGDPERSARDSETPLRCWICIRDWIVVLTNPPGLCAQKSNLVLTNPLGL